jgi:hypothetical protein
MKANNNQIVTANFDTCPWAYLGGIFLIRLVVMTEAGLTVGSTFWWCQPDIRRSDERISFGVHFLASHLRLYVPCLKVHLPCCCCCCCCYILNWHWTASSIFQYKWRTAVLPGSSRSSAPDQNFQDTKSCGPTAIYCQPQQCEDSHC